MRPWLNWPTLLAKHYCLSPKSAMKLLSLSNDTETNRRVWQAMFATFCQGLKALNKLTYCFPKFFHRKLSGFQFQQISLKACRDSFGSRLVLLVETISAIGLICFVSVNEY